MTEEVNAFNMLHAKMKKQGCRPAFSVLVTDESRVIGQKVLLLMPMELVKY